MQQIIYTNNVQDALEQVMAPMRPASVHVVTDTNVEPLTRALLPGAERIVIPAGDTAKTLDTAAQVWQTLVDAGATRRSVVVNIGGGMVTDLGGFCASTFKRGVRFINVPTTLLGAVDAAVGGKTGINFGCLKNEIGMFSEAVAVIVSTCFFASLPQTEILSGYAEMIKHAILSGRRAFAEALDHDPADTGTLLPLLRQSVEVKRAIVAADPTEQGLRRALNLGHTAGHAIETLAMRRLRPVPHGYAVAWGMVVELVMSVMSAGFPSDALHTLASYVRNNYGSPGITCADYDELIALMGHDKKNDRPDRISFTLMKVPGEPLPGQTADRSAITAALDIFRDLCQ